MGVRLFRFPSLAAVAVACTVAVAPAAASSNLGYRDHTYGSLTGSQTGSKAESKLWFNDGSWWASMVQPSDAAHHIYRLDRDSERWVDTGTRLDRRTSSRADVL